MGVERAALAVHGHCRFDTRRQAHEYVEESRRGIYERKIRLDLGVNGLFRRYIGKYFWEVGYFKDFGHPPWIALN